MVHQLTDSTTVSSHRLVWSGQLLKQGFFNHDHDQARPDPGRYPSDKGHVLDSGHDLREVAALSTKAIAASGNLVFAHPGTRSSWHLFPIRSLQRRDVLLPELQAHLECSVTCPSPELSPHESLDTAHQSRPDHPPLHANFVFDLSSIQPP